MLDTKRFIIDITHVPFVDLTAIFTLKDLVSKLKGLDIEVLIIAKENDIKQLKKLNKTGVFNAVTFYTDISEVQFVS
jgi:SulP family sulfate permease